MEYAELYFLYEDKIVKKGRTPEELKTVLKWFTGYDTDGLARQKIEGADLYTFFEQAPQINANADLITGTICGVKIAEIEDPLMKLIRQMDKLVDELAKGKSLDKILR